MSLRRIKTLFLIAALYDIVLGIVFGLLYKPVYNMFGAELPNHPGYIQLIAFYVTTFGIGFWLVYRNPKQSRQIIIIGILMKISFALAVFINLVFNTIPIPSVYITLAVMDLAFIPFFAGAYQSLGKMERMKSAASTQNK